MLLLDPYRFPFTRPLEENWLDIRRELDALDPGLFFPWYDEDAYSEGWTVCGLFGAEHPDKEEYFQQVRDACPRTAELVMGIPGLWIASFSALEPGAVIYPHEEPDFQTVRCHLALKIPPTDCDLRVGEETIHWREGTTLVFDNRGLHAAHNSSGERRVVLLIDVRRDAYGLVDTRPDEFSLAFESDLRPGPPR